MRKLLVIIPFVFLGLNQLMSQNNYDSCHCKKVIKSFKYFEKSFYKKGEYFHYPQKPVIIYVDGTRTKPPLNKHIQIMLDYTPVVLTDHGDLLIYKVSEKEIKQWAIWLQDHCGNRYKKYSKKHNFSKFKKEGVQQE